jgi:predicted 3-demethylubiquinone-9 3-methyltransferase (glyoxalase superfamily)
MGWYNEAAEEAVIYCASVFDKSDILAVVIVELLLK